MDAKHPEQRDLPVFLCDFRPGGSTRGARCCVGRYAPADAEEQGWTLLAGAVARDARAAGRECAFLVHSLQSLAIGGQKINR